MTELFAEWISQPSEVELERIARKVATVSMDEAQNSLNSHWGRQSTSEARGYLRARSRRVVTEQTRQVLGPVASYSAKQTQGIVSRALELTVDRLLRQQRCQKPSIQLHKLA